jgi:DNA polymerase III subunit beta
MKYTNESLTALKRDKLIQAAIKTGACSASAAYSTKSVKLIELILAKTAPKVEETTPVAVAETPVETAAAVEVQAAPAAVAVAEEGESIAGADEAGNVVQFTPEATQTELPQAEQPHAEAPKPVSNGLFKVSRKVFQRMLSSVSKLPGGHDMAILNCVLIQFTNGRLAVECTNLDVNVRSETAAETDGAYSLAVPFAVLSKFVAKCTSDFLMAEAKGNSLAISDMENRTEIHTLPVSDWPPAPEHTDVAVMHIAGRELARVITETIKSASTDESRFILNGLFLTTKACANEVVATDGRRLVRVPVAIEESFSAIEAIIPSHAAEVIRSGIPQDAIAKISRSQSSRGIRIVSENNGYVYRVTTKLIEGNYPNYEQVIPKDMSVYSGYSVNSEEFLAALGRVLVVATSGENKTPTVYIDVARNAVSVSAANVNVGNGKETLTAKGGTDEFKLRIAVNGEMLREIVGSWGDESVVLQFRDPVAPILVKAGEKTAVVMPVRLT